MLQPQDEISVIFNHCFIILRLPLTSDDISCAPSVRTIPITTIMVTIENVIAITCAAPPNLARITYRNNNIEQYLQNIQHLA